MKPSEKLKELNITLPPAPAPVGSYVAGVRMGNMIACSGQIPISGGKISVTGKVGQDLSIEDAQNAARVCALNGLAILADLAGGIDKIARIIRLGVFVNSAEGFGDQPKVANAASDLMVAIFGDAGKHIRAAVGCSGLPLNVPVEIEMTAETRD